MKIAAVTLLLLIGATLAGACDLVIAWTDVRPVLNVIVSDPSGDPLTGVSVRAELLNAKDEPEGRSIQSSTDEKGIAHLSALKTGKKYRILIAVDTAFPQSRYVQVAERSIEPIQSRLRFVWPEERILRLRVFKGVLKTMGDRTQWDGHPFAGTALLVRDAKTNREVAQTTADALGSFSISGLAPGFYRVDVSYRTAAPLAPKSVVEMSGSLALRIVSESDAVDEPVEIALAFSSCGLAYRARVVPN